MRLGGCFIDCNDPGDWSSFLFLFCFFHLKHDSYFDRTHILTSRQANLCISTSFDECRTWCLLGYKWWSTEIETKPGNILHAMLCILKALFVICLHFCSRSVLIFGKSIMILWSFNLFLKKCASEYSYFWRGRFSAKAAKLGVRKCIADLLCDLGQCTVIFSFLFFEIYVVFKA